MRSWQFMDYCSEAGNNLIEEWYRRQDSYVQADFDVTLNILAGTTDWRGLSEFKLLHGKHRGLAEIRFRTNNVQYRPVGFFGPGRGQFTLLVVCRKKQRVYDPPDAFDLALKRRAQWKQGKGKIVEHFL